ncbi:MAG: hypothetical protein LBV20_01905, partial [Treponema sp.]|nr:hypothetical protein [Treponema sp.]
MKLKIFFLSLVVFCVLALPLSAQQSNLNRATLSVFGSDVDNFMNVNHWADVDLEKDFGFVGISPAQYALEVGYAHQFDAFRLGAYYNGNIFQTTTPITKTKSVVTTNTYGADGAVTAMISKITFEGVSGGVGVSQNNIGVLVGLGGMGFKL